MSQIRPDVLFVIHYKFGSGTEEDVVRIETNCKTEFVSELLGDYIRSKMGMGGHDEKFDKREEYVIKLGIAFDDDSWGCEDNCGSISLRLGILMDTLRKVDGGKATILPLPGEQKEETNVVDDPNVRVPPDAPVRTGAQEEG